MRYDLVVIGSGPGGYIAAIRAAQLGMKIAIIEKYAVLGGTCSNVGCIPSKALLDSSEHFHNAKNNFINHGIHLKELRANIAQMIQRKNTVVNQACGGISFLMKKNKIDVFHGMASFLDKKKLRIHKENRETQIINADKIIIATGSKPITIPSITYDKRKIITSTEALNISDIPQKMIIIGGGIIGLEIGSIYARLGTEITVIEFLDRLIPSMDKTIAKELQKVLQKTLNFTFHFFTEVKNARIQNDIVSIKAENRKKEHLFFEADYCLMSVGRKPYTQGLRLEKIGIKLDNEGRIKVNDYLQTNIVNIYAIGDVIKGPMLAHKAEEEGIFVAEHIAGQKPHINYSLIPGVIYTWPEVAGVGYTEEFLKEKKRKYKVGSFPFRALGRAITSMDLDGLVKVLADFETDELLGIHIIGPRAADMIAEATVALEYRASAEDIARVSHAHPTFSEAIKEACLMATENRALHI